MAMCGGIQQPEAGGEPWSNVRSGYGFNHRLFSMVGDLLCLFLLLLGLVMVFFFLGLAAGSHLGLVDHVDHPQWVADYHQLQNVGQEKRHRIC